MISNPGRLIDEILTPFSDTFKYLLGQWLPLAFIPVVAPHAWAIAIFPLLKLFLSQGDLVLSISIRYAISITPGLFYGSILWWAGQGFGNFKQLIGNCRPRKLRPKFRRFWIFCICLSVFFTITSNPSETLYFLVPSSFKPLVYVSAPEQWQHSQKIRAFLAQIPADASVSGSTFIVPHVSSRREVIRLPGLEVKNEQQEINQVDYIIADLWRMERYQVVFNDYRNDLKASAKVISHVLRLGEYGIIGFNDGVVLLQKAVNSDPEAIKDWQTYFQKIQPIIES